MSDPAFADSSPRRDAAPGEERLHGRCLANELWAKFYLGWELIGRGAYGTVVGTRHRTFGDIAVKAFEWLSSQEETRFDQEAAALARLNHPAIVRIYGAFKDDGLYWFEMERVHGPTLKEALETRQKQGRPFAFQDALEIAIDVTEALQAAHAAGLIHRDVKPANVLLPEPRAGQGPRAKLGDFGVSRLFDAGRLTATGVVVGSYEYAAPELFAGRTATSASDVYSFTLLMYRLLTDNAYPYEINGDRTPVAFMEAHTKQVALPVGLLNRELTQDLQDLITLGLAKDPRRRPSWDEIVGVLRQSKGRSPVTSERDRVADPAARPMERAARTFLGGLRPKPAAARYMLGISVMALAGTLVVARGWTARPSLDRPRLRPETPQNVPSAGASAAVAAPAAAGPAETRGEVPATQGFQRPGDNNSARERADTGAQDTSSAGLGVAVELAGDALKVRNVSGRTVSIGVTAIARSGSRHTATIWRLEPGLQHTVFLDALKPPALDPTDLANVEVVELNSSSKRPTQLGPRR
jgi:hypothetical protein